MKKKGELLIERMERIAFSEIIRHMYMKTMYQKKYGPLVCACGEHNCEDCTNNTDGNPENCREWICYAGAECKFRPGLQYLDWGVCRSRGCEYYENGFAGFECLAGFDYKKIMTCQKSKNRLKIKGAADNE